MLDVITDNLDIWTTAQKQKKAVGRGSAKKEEGYGIKKLRELILELAVRGKLVPQDPNDEPASVLLEKIAEEKQRLIDEGTIKKQKVLPKIEEDKKNFDIPEGWEWVFIPQIIRNDKYAIKRGPFGSAIKKDYFVPSGVKVYEQQHAINNDFSLGHYYINQEKFEELKAFEVKPQDLIISCSGTVGKVAEAPKDMEKGIINQALLKLSLNQKSLLNNYFKILFPAFYLKTNMLANLQGTAQKNMVSVATLKEEPFPLPPLAEQHRIVAKVDELMALCDQLEQEQADHQATHQTLVKTLLNGLIETATHRPIDPSTSSKLTAQDEQASTQHPVHPESTEAKPPEAQTTADYFNQLIAQHFDTLFTTEDSIDQLKQTILQLAVMGKLIPQNPKDEPASVLLEKIAQEKAKLIKEGKIKKQKALPEITEDEKPFGLPSSWELVRLADLLPSFQNGASSRGDKEGKEVIVLRLADIKSWAITLEDTRALVIAESTIGRYSLKQNDVLVIRVNGSADIVGRFILCDQDLDAIYCDHFIRMRFPLEIIASSYLKLLGSSSLVRSSISDLFISTAGQKTVNQKHIGSLLLTLPPINEQHRIVTKVNQLLSLCDTLKTNLNQAQTTQTQLADTIVKQAVN